MQTAAKGGILNPEPAVSQVYEQQIQQLQEELRKVRDRLKSAELKSNQPSPFVVELQKEMTSMKVNKTFYFVFLNLLSLDCQFLCASTVPFSSLFIMSSFKDLLFSISFSVWLCSSMCHFIFFAILCCMFWCTSKFLMFSL